MFIKYVNETDESQPRFEITPNSTTEIISNTTISIFYKSMPKLESESLNSNDSFILQIVDE
jgi:hypothetical protein